MMSKTLIIFFLINIHFLISNANQNSDFNETNFNSQLSELRAEQEHHRKLIGKIVKDRQGKLLEGLVKASDINVLREELEQQKKKCGLFRESDIQSLRTDDQTLRAELERLKYLTDGLFKASMNHNSLLHPRNCTEAKFSGVYNLHLSTFNTQPFSVACDAVTRGGGWTVILRRMDGSVDFYRNWAEYKNGFGELSGEFFLGLDKIHAITEERRHELLVVLEDYDYTEKFMIYDEFAIGNENEKYVLHTLGDGKGTAGESFARQRGMKFSTYDQDNDKYLGNCAKICTGAWWYNDCYQSNLAGKYLNGGKDGIVWKTFRGWHYSLKSAIMMIRPRK